MHQGIQQDDDYDVFNVSSLGVSTLCSCRFWWQMFYLNLKIEKIPQQLRSVEFSFDFGNRPWVSWWSEALVEARSTRSLWNDPLTWGPCLFSGDCRLLSECESIFFNIAMYWHCLTETWWIPSHFRWSSCWLALMSVHSRGFTILFQWLDHITLTKPFFMLLRVCVLRWLSVNRTYLPA